jgi:hypothetical protein
MTPSEHLLLQALEEVTHETCRVTTKMCAFLLSGEEDILEFLPPRALRAAKVTNRNYHNRDRFGALSPIDFGRTWET